MQKILSRGLMLLCAAFSFAFVQAQGPVLNAGDFIPSIGESFFGQLLDSSSTNSIVPGSGGANLSWNYVNLTGSQADTVLVLLPDSPIDDTLFPNADHRQFHSFDSSYHYYDVDGGVMNRVGLAVGGLTVRLPDGEKYFDFPMQYGDSFADTLAGTLSFGGTSGTRSGTIQVVADGYGELILPSGTYSNVLRFRYELNYVDDFPTGSIVHFDEVYVWIVRGFHYPVLAKGLYSVGGQVSAVASLFVPVLATVDEESPELLEATVFPNPATNLLTVDLRNSKHQQVKYELVDVTGTTLQTGSPGRFTSGAGSFQVPMNGVSSGLYFLKVKAGKMETVEKILIR